MKRITNPQLIELKRAAACVISGERPVDVHHLMSRKAGGPDLDWNLCPLKREYHNEIHNGGKARMAKKYEKFKQFLILKGWYLCPVRKKWIHEEMFTCNKAHDGHRESEIN